jgi:hypothetical protein
LAALSNADNSATQGGHHVAQKFTKTGRPCNDSSRKYLSFSSRTIVDIDGAALPSGGVIAVARSGQIINVESPIMLVKSWRRVKDAVFG